MAGAFQSNAFQNSAFQTAVAPPVVVTPPVTYGGGGRKVIRHKHGEIYWPRLTRKRTKEEIVAEVVADALEQVAGDVPRELDVGVLAHDLIQHVGYQTLRQIQTYEEMIVKIKRELDERDDEEALLLLI